MSRSEILDTVKNKGALSYLYTYIRFFKLKNILIGFISYLSVAYLPLMAIIPLGFSNKIIRYSYQPKSTSEPSFSNIVDTLKEGFITYLLILVSSSIIILPSMGVYSIIGESLHSQLLIFISFLFIIFLVPALITIYSVKKSISETIVSYRSILSFLSSRVYL